MTPRITLIGDATLSVPANSAFTDPSATATDNIDGDISNRIVATSNVDVRVMGTYNIRYDVTDSAGNRATTVTRTVRVVPAEGTGGGGGGSIDPLLLMFAALLALVSHYGPRALFHGRCRLDHGES